MITGDQAHFEALLAFAEEMTGQTEAIEEIRSGEEARAAALEELRGASWTWKLDGIYCRSTLAGDVLTNEEAYGFCSKRWLRPDPAVTTVAVMIAESGLYSEAILEYGESAEEFVPNGVWDAGLYQLNSRWNPGLTKEAAFEPVEATNWAFRAYEGRDHTWSAWSSWSAGAHLKYMRRGIKGMANSLATKYGVKAFT